VGVFCGRFLWACGRFLCGLRQFGAAYESLIALYGLRSPEGLFLLASWSWHYIYSQKSILPPPKLKQINNLTAK
jgi:hypothetical protein